MIPRILGPYVRIFCQESCNRWAVICREDSNSLLTWIQKEVSQC